MSASKKVVALRKAGRPRSTAPRPDIVVEKTYRSRRSAAATRSRT